MGGGLCYIQRDGNNASRELHYRAAQLDMVDVLGVPHLILDVHAPDSVLQ